MHWNILDRNMHILLSPDTRADASLPIYHDKQIIELKNNCAIGTYDFTVNQQDPDAKTLQLGNYISFVDKYGKTRLYTLMSHDGDEYEQTWHAEDIGLDLINEVADKWKYNEPHTFAWYAENLLLYDSGWSIGINEIGNLTRSLTFDGQSDSVLTRLGDLANQFDGAEIDFEVQMSGSAVTKQVINVYKKLGSDLTQQRFVDAVNLKALSTNGSINDLRTAMIGYGSTPDNGGENAEPITFANIEYDDGRYFTLKGDKTVCDRVAGQTWARAGAFDTTNKNALKGYIVGIYTYDTKDPNELLKRTITNLKTVNEPQIGYEADLLDLQADIGDTVQIAHRQYNPPIYLSARVQEVENCYTEVGQDTGKLGNYQILESNIDPRITSMMDKISAQKASYVWVRYADDDKGTNMSILPAGKKYVAVVSVKGNATPSDDPADYAGYWLPLGQDGSNGTPGAPGKDGKTTYNHNAWADDVNGKTGFSTSYADGKLYVGQYSDFVQADSTDPSKYTWARFRGEDGKDGVAGKAGVGIKSTAITYALSTSGTSAPSSGWVASPPAVPAGQYLWTKTVWSYTDNTNETGYSVSKMGETGKTGATGPAGKGIASTVVNYQASTSGTSIPTGTWLATIPTVAANQYLWTRTTWSYTDNTSANGYSVGKMGGNGAKGDPGATGNGIKSVVASYQNATSGTVIPTGSWVATPPNTPQGQYLWTRNLTTFTNGGTSASYSVAYSAKDGQKGDKGNPGSKDVPVVTVGTSYPAKPKSGDMHWLTNSSGNVIGYYVYNGSTWVANKIDAKTIAAETFTGLTFTGNTFNGSQFNTSFKHVMISGDGQGFGDTYASGTARNNGAINAVDGTIDGTTQKFHNETNPAGTFSYVTNTDGKTIAHSVQTAYGTLSLTDWVSGASPNAQYVGGTLSASDIMDTGWQKLIFSGGAITNPNNPVKIRRIGKMVYLTGDLRLPKTTGYVWCSIPQEFRPEYDSVYIALAENPSLYQMIFWVHTDGKISTRYNSQATMNYHLAGTSWAVKEVPL